MENLSNLYQQKDLHTKRTIRCLIFPQKVEFDGTAFRTAEMNAMAKYIYLANNELANKKTDIELLKILMSV